MMMKHLFGLVIFLFVSSPLAETNPSLIDAWNSDGTFMDGTSGSFDPTGFQMTYMEDGTPIFTTLESQNSAPAHLDQGTRGSWFALGSGLNDLVKAVATSGADVYVGGSFTNAGGDPSASYISRWDGSSWNPLGVGLALGSGPCPVHAIAVSGSDVYVGGNFTYAGGNPDANSIARWDGSNWHSLGTGCSFYSIEAIAVAGSDVYVGGYFFNVGGNPDLDGIARWDGSNWHSLGSGIDGGVLTIAVNGSDVYVGGGFTDAGGNPNADYIARWDGTSWNSLAAGLNNLVFSILVSGDDLYVGGQFDNAGGNPNAVTIARWDGSNWHSLGTEIEAGQAQSLALYGSDLFAGGDFYTPQNPLLNGVIKWDGSSWNSLGSSAGGVLPALYGVKAIAISDANVYAGGFFPSAGDVPNTANIAGWDINASGIASPEQQGSFIFPVSPNPSGGDVTIQYSLANPSDALVSIYDVSGRLVSTLASGEHSTGLHQAHVACLSSGVYICQLRVGSNSLSQSFVVIR